MEHITYFVLICILLAACVSDFRTYQISNKIIIAGGIAGGLVRFFEDSYGGLGLWMCGCVCMLAVFYWLYALSMMGAGDIKLFAVIGGMLGIKRGMTVIIAAFCIAAFISLMLIIKRRNGLQRMKYLVDFVSEIDLKKEIRYMDLKNKDKTACMHFTLPLLIAVVLLRILALFVKKGGVF